MGIADRERQGTERKQELFHCDRLKGETHIHEMLKEDPDAVNDGCVGAAVTLVSRMLDDYRARREDSALSSIPRRRSLCPPSRSLPAPSRIPRRAMGFSEPPIYYVHRHS